MNTFYETLITIQKKLLRGVLLFPSYTMSASSRHSCSGPLHCFVEPSSHVISFTFSFKWLASLQTKSTELASISKTGHSHSSPQKEDSVSSWLFTIQKPSQCKKSQKKFWTKISASKARYFFPRLLNFENYSH